MSGANIESSLIFQSALIKGFSVPKSFLKHFAEAGSVNNIALFIALVVSTAIFLATSMFSSYLREGLNTEAKGNKANILISNPFTQNKDKLSNHIGKNQTQSANNQIIVKLKDKADIASLNELNKKAK